MDILGTEENITGSQHNGVITLCVGHFHMSNTIEGICLGRENYIRIPNCCFIVGAFSLFLNFSGLLLLSEFTHIY
jgi:hypothetical protein